MKSTKPSLKLQYVFRLLCLVAGFSLQVDLAKADDFLEDGSSTPLQIDIVDDLVSLNARDVPVENLLDEIARQTDLIVVLHGPLEHRITLELNQFSLAETLRHILRDVSFALYEAKNESAVKNPRHRATLWVFSGETANPMTHTAMQLRPSSASSSTVDIESLESDMVNGETHIRKRAVKGLRKLDANDAITPLSLALVDEDEDVRVKAVYALADIGGDEAAASLSTALNDASAWVRTEAAYALGATGGDTAIQVLKQAMRDTDQDVRESAIEAYTDIGGEDSARALAMALDDPNTSLQIEAVDGLGEIGGDAAIQVLQHAIDHKKYAVREAVIEALVDIGGDDAAYSLATALNDENTKLRAHAVDALGRIGGQTAINLLRQALDDLQRSIREAADKNLAKTLRIDTKRLLSVTFWSRSFAE
jgi:HEAT repeat protein